MSASSGRCTTIAAAVLLSCLSPAHPAGQQPPPTFKSGIDVVLLDVSVVDKGGRPVGDLGPADFSVAVDGRPRTITSVQFLTYELRSTTATGGSRTAAPAAPPAVLPTAPIPPRIVVIAIDEDSLEPGEGLVARQAAAKFLDRLAPNDRVGVVTIPRLKSEVVVSTRRSDARKALDRVIAGVARDPYEFQIGLAEAFDIERGFTDVLAKVVRRECGRRNTEVPDATLLKDNPCAVFIKGQCRQMELQARNRAQRSFDALAILADAVSGADGPKTLVLISGGMPMPDGSSAAAFDRLESAFGAAQVTLYTVYLERSSLFGQVQYRPSPTAMDDDRLETEGIENATSAVGGTLMLGIGTLDQYFDRVVTELSGSYLLGVEVTAADRDGRPHRVEVKVTRPGVEVRARRRYVIEPPRPSRADPAARPASRTPAKPSPPPPITLEMMTPEVEAAVARAGAYAAAYETELSALVAEERYLQRAFKFETLTVAYTRPSGPVGKQTTTENTGEWIADGERVLKADFLLVKAQGSDRWMPFRDVFEVDGRKVREREERLQRLFLEAPATAAERAAAISGESARYNIGFVQRNVNLPTLPLRLLDPARRAGVIFRKVRETKLSGITTWELAFAERGSPTLVRDGARDIPATGTFWIDPAAGRVVRSSIRFEVGTVVTEMTVTYRQDDKADGTWVPAEMRESYQSATRKVECTATYSKVRRFQVTTK